jgi:hypothetical protein
MTLREGDTVVIKPGGSAAFTLSGGLVKCNYYKELEAATYLAVSYQDPDGEVGVLTPDRKANGIISRNQLLRVFKGGYREGDSVYIEVAKAYGTVVDADPNSAEVDRANTVPVRIDSISNLQAESTGLHLGAVAYTETEFIRKSLLPRGAVVGQASVVALGGQGGAGGIAVGPGAVGGRGGNGGSATVITPKATVPKDAASLLNTDSAVIKPKYEDVTEGATWQNLLVGDIVTAEHKSRPATLGRGSSAEVLTSRTSEVVRGTHGNYWCELELDGSNRYDPYKITKVLRLRPPRTLVERRNPIKLTVLRLVPPQHVWGGTTLNAQGLGVVEQHVDDGHYWLYFTEGEHAGKRLRLKVGRDQISYDAIVGTYVARDSFEELVAATHHKE